MMSQEHVSESKDEQAGSMYGRYEGEQEYAPQRDEISNSQFLGERSGEKVFLPARDNTNLFRFLVFVIAMLTLLAFVFVCLVIVGGTGGWISFCAASVTILTIASTFISVKGAKEK